MYKVEWFQYQYNYKSGANRHRFKLKPVKHKWMKKGEQKRRGYVCAPSDGHTCDLFPTPALSGQVQRVYSQPLHHLVKKHPQISGCKVTNSS